MGSSFLSGCCDCGPVQPTFSICATVLDCHGNPVPLAYVRANGPSGPADDACYTGVEGGCCFHVKGEAEWEVYVYDSNNRKVAIKVKTVAGTPTYYVTFNLPPTDVTLRLMFQVDYCDGEAALPGAPGGTPLTDVTVPGYTVMPPTVSPYNHPYIEIPPNQPVTFPIAGTVTYKECVPSCAPSTPVIKTKNFRFESTVFANVCDLPTPPITHVDITSGWANFGASGCGGNPLPGATITTAAGSCVTDDTGCCQIEGTPHAVIGDVTVTARGYNPYTYNHGPAAKYGYCAGFAPPDQVNTCPPLGPGVLPWNPATDYFCAVQCGVVYCGIECPKPVKRLLYIDGNGTWPLVGTPTGSSKQFCAEKTGGPIVPDRCTLNSPGTRQASRYVVNVTCNADPENPGMIRWHVSVTWCVTPCRALFTTYWDPIWQYDVKWGCHDSNNQCWSFVSLSLDFVKPKCMSPVTLAGTWPDAGSVTWGPGPPTFPASFASECPAKGPWVIYEPFP